MQKLAELLMLVNLALRSPPLMEVEVQWVVLWFFRNNQPVLQFSDTKWVSQSSMQL